MRIARAVSVATRAYSSAFLWPICQGPSISLPRHHMRMSWDSGLPVLGTRWSDRCVPAGALAYSSTSSASCTPRVPRVTAYIGPTSAPRAQALNPSRPTVLGSEEGQDRDRKSVVEGTGGGCRQVCDG